MNFAEYWQYTDAVTKSLFFILLALSVVSWMTGIMRLYASLQLRHTISDYLETLVNDKVRFNQSIQSTMSGEQRKIVTEQALLQGVARLRYGTDKGMPILGTTASVSPFVGLFGTVWGIFHALHSIGQSGQAGLAQVAGPVGEALIMTGLGLAVAIPAVIFYNIASRVNRSVMHQANDVAHDILAKSVMFNSTEG